MPEDCPFQFYIDAKTKFCRIFLVLGILIFLVGAAVGLYAYLRVESLHSDQMKILLAVSGTCITGISAWLLTQCYQHFKPVSFLKSVCGRLAVLQAQPDGGAVAEQIAKLTENGWSVCNEP